ncbi:uncharacterized protein LOC108596007 [Drosophila busckii]|uniref:uncharacterized protein LOC108596007 n=1 Tax=Drosophila busckii TaxID=30019 RepID=UPI00083F00CD|nr:uncharacterized protein LOC108596007 [Drosophila busckii]
MKYIFLFTLVASLVLAMAMALVEIHRGSPNGPSGRFAHTVNWAAPPADLRQPPVYLPLATPIEEPGNP